MSKPSQSERDYTLIKQGAISAVFLVALIFGQDLRNSIFKPPAPADYSNLIIRLEAQNNEQTRLTQQFGDQANIIGDLQKVQAQIGVQVRILADVVGAMQQREYARLGVGSK